MMSLRSQEVDTMQQTGGGFMLRLSAFGEHAMDYLTFNRGRHSLVVFPVAGYSPVAKLELGVMPIWRIAPLSASGSSYYRPTTIATSLLASTTGMFEFEVDVETFTRQLWTAKLKSQFVYLPDRYYPIGNQAVDVDPIKYKAYRYRLEGHLMKGWREVFFYGVEVDAGFNEHHGRDGMMLPEEAVGSSGGWCNALGPMVALDTRDNPTWPERGVYVKMSSLFAGRFLGSEYRFEQYVFDGRLFVKPFRQDGILAAQLYVERGDGSIPFYKMPAIGGKAALRGISHPLKYINNNAWYGQAEYRRHLWWRFSGVVFGGVGASSADFSGAFDRVYGSVGAGLRIQVMPDQKLHLRIDYGVANGGDHGLYLTLRESF
ncbi:BamA/TamA family outer membrane protein [Breznakibacter xylanolyticus]|nr:BamA/TamA family outer membrane protein [Breznakibacter xylanolyticus]